MNQLINQLALLWDDPHERSLLENTIRALDVQYGLSGKMTKEPGVAEIIAQMTGRLADAVGNLSTLQGKKILDIACGSNTSKFPGLGAYQYAFRRNGPWAARQSIHCPVRAVVLPHARWSWAPIRLAWTWATWKAKPSRTIASTWARPAHWISCQTAPSMPSRTAACSAHPSSPPNFPILRTACRWPGRLAARNEVAQAWRHPHPLRRTRAGRIESNFSAIIGTSARSGSSANP